MAAIILILISAGLIAADSEEISEESKILKNKTQSEKNLEEFEESKAVREESLKNEISIKENFLPTKDLNIDELGLDKALSGDNHLRIIGALCFLLFAVHHDVFIILIFLPFIIAIFFKTGKNLFLFVIFKRVVLFNVKKTSKLKELNVWKRLF